MKNKFFNKMIYNGLYNKELWNVLITYLMEINMKHKNILMLLKNYCFYVKNKFQQIMMEIIHNLI